MIRAQLLLSSGENIVLRLGLDNAEKSDSPQLTNGLYFKLTYDLMKREVMRVENKGMA